MDALVVALGRRRRGPLIALAIAVVAIVAALVWWPSGKPDERALMPVDQQGCDCPLAWCVFGACHGQCTAGDYELGSPIPGITRPSHQEVLAGASRDGEMILYLAGEGCALRRLFVAYRRGLLYQPYDLTDQLDPARFSIYEGCCTLADNGKSLLIASADRTSFVRARLDNGRVLPPFEPVGELIPGSKDRRWVQHPVETADGAKLYFMLHDYQSVPGDHGPLHGEHIVTRSHRDAPFERPHRITGSQQSYGWVTGISDDELTIFTAFSWETYAMIRPNAAEPFYAIGARFNGWRAIPIENCQRLVTTSTPGGCHAEDIVFATAVPRD
jgi:hypothetical protein